MTRTRWGAGAAILLLALAAVGAVATEPGAGRASAAARPGPAGTAAVQRRTLSALISQAGTLSYRARPDGSPYAVINHASGTYTELPGLGRVIAPGHVLYRVNDRPVVLLRGSTPAYRTLAAGVAGPDVAELNADLVALGYATHAALPRGSRSFGPATTAAVIKLQAALGVSRTGALGLGQVVFEPVAVRVTSLSAAPGGRAQPGATVLQGTSTVRQVQLALNASQQATLAVGDRVSISLPDNRTVPGVVSSVGAVATCPSSSTTGAPGQSTASAGTDSCASSSATPTVPVGVTPSDPAAARRWDQAPVQVGITTATVRNALVVPVTALLARSGGGYAVEVAGPGPAHHLVPVSLGLFDDADGLVQVSAALAPGQQVVVPTS